MTEGTRRALTAREREVMALIARGMSNKEIARALKIDHGTVKVHVRNLFLKMNLRNRTMVAMAAYKEFRTE